MGRWAKGPGALLFAGMLVLAGCGDDGSTPSAVEPSSDGGALTTDDEADGDTGVACVPNESRSCYGGPVGTAGLGACRAGLQRCAPDGTAWLPCEGEVLPQAQESCETPQDDDCDGSTLCELGADWSLPFNSGPGFHMLGGDADGNTFITPFQSTVLLGEDTFEGLFMAKLGPQGELLSVLTVPSTTGQALVRDMVVDAQGQVTVVGQYTGAPDLGGGPLPSTGAQGFIARFDNDGVLLWNEPMDVLRANDLAVGPDGSSYVLAESLGVTDDGFVDPRFLVTAYDATGERGWTVTAVGVDLLMPENMSIAFAEDKLVVVVGLAVNPVDGATFGELPIEVEPGQYELVMFSINTAGNPLSSELLFGPEVGSENNAEVLAGPDGTVFVVAGVRLEQGVSVQVVVDRFDRNLEHLSRWVLGDPAVLRGAGVLTSGQLALGLSFSGVFTLGPIGVGTGGESDGYVLAALDDEGNAQWLQLLHSTFVSMRSFATTPDGAIVVGATTQTANQIGDASLSGPWLAKLRPN